MNYITDPKEKVELIKSRFSELIGKEITHYELPQIVLESKNEWDDWMDLPLFLTFGDRTLSISWDKFDDLAIEEGRVIPFSLCGYTVRWLCEGVEILEKVLGKTLTSVSLGIGEMNLDGRDIEIWTRVLLSLNDESTLDIFNALDENGIELFSEKPKGESIKCT